MAVQNPQAPGGKHQQPGAGEKNPHQRNREVALGSGKPRRDEIDQPRRRQHAGQTQHRNRQRQCCRHRARHSARFFLLALGQQARVDGNERRRQHAFAEKILEKIRDAKRGVEGVGRIRAQSEIVREHAQPDQTHQAAEQNAGGHQKRESSRALALADRRVSQLFIQNSRLFKAGQSFGHAQAVRSQARKLLLSPVRDPRALRQPTSPAPPGNSPRRAPDRQSRIPNGNCSSPTAARRWIRGRGRATSESSE